MWRPTPWIAALALLLTLPISAAAELPATWPQWRGPTRDGRVSGNDWPERLDSEHLRQLWRVELDAGYSGPIVAADRVFVTETVNQKTEKVTALARSTGKPLWTAQWPGSLSVPLFAKANGDWIRATPAYDGQTLYVAGIREVLVALEADTGTERWRFDFPEQLNSPLPAFGFASSPLVHRDAIFVQAGGGFCKLDKQTGKLQWRVLEDGGGMDGSAYSSPVVATINDVEQLVVQTRTHLCSVEPAAGRELWKTRIKALQGMNILTPTIDGNRVFTSSHGGEGVLIGVIGPVGERPVSALQVWTNRLQGYMSSPMLHQGHVYLPLQNQRFACVDLTTGQSAWMTEPFGKYWSLVAQGNKLLALDETGELLLIRMSPTKFDLLDRRQLIENAWAHLAVAGEEIFIRDLQGITAYHWKSP